MRAGCPAFETSSERRSAWTRKTARFATRAETTPEAQARLKDDSLDHLDDLPPTAVLQQEIIDHLEAALAAFQDVAAGLPGSGREVEDSLPNGNGSRPLRPICR